MIRTRIARAAAVVAVVLFAGLILRRLHLVRPDLIFYPIPVDVYASGGAASGINGGNVI